MHCIECGACCFSDSDRYVTVSESDCERLGPRRAAVVCEFPDGRYLRMAEGRCASLKYSNGWVCSIYSVRPDACREVERGSPECLEERKWKRRRVTKALRLLTDEPAGADLPREPKIRE